MTLQSNAAEVTAGAGVREACGQQHRDKGNSCTWDGMVHIETLDTATPP